MSRLLCRLLAREWDTPRPRPPVRQASDLRARLLVQALEGRIAPATFNVTNVNDSGAGSLRQAILDANAAGTTDVIEFDASFNTARTINLTSGELLIADAVSITGLGASLLTVRRDPSATTFRVFHVDAPDVAAVNISRMTISGGRTAANDGAALLMFNDAVTLDGVVITGNTSGSEGGAIAVASVNSGGGGSLTIRNSTISGNAATGTPPAGSFGGGGGGFYFANGGVLLVENSTISGNRSVNSVRFSVWA